MKKYILKGLKKGEPEITIEESGKEDFKKLMNWGDAEFANRTKIVEKEEPKIEPKVEKSYSGKAKRFESEREHSIIGKLNYFFSSDIESITEEDAVKHGACVIDPANVCMINGKTEEAKRVLARYISFESEKKEMPNWDFISDGKSPSTSRFSMEYVKKIIELLNASDSETLSISVKNNHPFIMENKHFACILAPRIESED